MGGRGVGKGKGSGKDKVYIDERGGRHTSWREAVESNAAYKESRGDHPCESDYLDSHPKEDK